MRWDYYVFAPNGQKFRSNVEIKKFLQTNPSVKCDLDVTNTSRVNDLEKKSPTMKRQKSETFNRRLRRVRCKNCEACLLGDCKQCVYCKDMTRYGGPGRMKQSCEKRRCLDPKEPVETTSEFWTEDQIMKYPSNNQLEIVDGHQIISNDQVKLVHEEKKPLKSIIMQIKDGFDEESGIFVKSETDIKTPEMILDFSESDSNHDMPSVSSDPLDITVHEEKSKTKVKCFLCPALFDAALDLSDLTKHLNTEHKNQNKAKNPSSTQKLCPLCPALFNERSDFNKHFSTEHAVSIQRKITSPSHKMTIHVKDDPLDMTDPTISRSIQEGKSEIKIKVKCLLCPQIFDTVSDFNKHDISYHAEDKQAENTSSTHQMTIVKDDPLKITGPTILDSNKHLSTAHKANIRSSHEGKDEIKVKYFKCPVCLKLFDANLDSYLDYKKHFATEHEVDKQTKNAEVPYKMTIVKVDPFDATDLNKRISTAHEANKQLIDPDSKRKKGNKCAICLKVLTKSHDLKRHFSRIHGFECQFCPLKFVLKRDWYDHVKFVHSNKSESSKNVLNNGVNANLVQKSS